MQTQKLQRVCTFDNLKVVSHMLSSSSRILADGLQRSLQSEYRLHGFSGLGLVNAGNEGLVRIFIQEWGGLIHTLCSMTSFFETLSK